MVAEAIDQERLEALGPAEKTIQALTQFNDHLVHNRPGFVVTDRRTRIGLRWDQATWKLEGEGDDKQKVVYRVTKVGTKQTKTRVGVLDADGKTVREANRVVGEYRKPGIFPEVAAFLYRQVAEVFRLDNEFAAQWASWQFQQDHRDMKVVLAAFMLVQDRSGEPVRDNGKIVFHDSDFRAVGEAICLVTGKGYIDAKMLLRIGDVLNLDCIAEVNRELGFGISARNPARGRYYKVVEKWLRYREQNPRMLKALVNKQGFRTTIQKLARRVGYKPATPQFFEILRWKQKQAGDGRRAMAIGAEVAKAETWDDLDEKAICERIVKDKPNWKRIVGQLPATVGLTRAIVAAAVEANSLSDADLIMLTPTIEDLGLLKVKVVHDRWKEAIDKAENQRAANVAKNVKTETAKKGLEEAADKAVQKAFEEVAKDLRVYVIVDKSGSMEGAIEKAKGYLSQFLQGFKLDQLHVSIFNTMGRELTIAHPSAAGVEQAFRGHYASGGTSYAEGVRAVSHRKPRAEEDVLMLFVGDQLDNNVPGLVASIQVSGLKPVAFGMLQVENGWHQRGYVVEQAATQLGIPCFPIEEGLFEDPYSVTRTLRNLIDSTPVGQAVGGIAPKQRVTLVEKILKTELLAKPVWA